MLAPSWKHQQPLPKLFRHLYRISLGAGVSLFLLNVGSSQLDDQVKVLIQERFEEELGDGAGRAADSLSSHSNASPSALANSVTFFKREPGLVAVV